MKQALRLFHTVKHLRAKQIGYRLYYRWQHLTAPPLQTETQARVWAENWYSPQWQSPCMSAERQFEFLNELGYVDYPSDWNNTAKSKLWLYNLHYLDELNTQNVDNRVVASNHLIDRWINDNPAPNGNGWEPYPLSLRLVNLVKWQMRRQYSGSRLLDSIKQQAIALSKQIEYHIMANHLFANGKALVFAGAALADEDALLQQGLGILDTEIPKQFLADGGHFELSPMYHSILLWDMCDLLNLAKTSAVPALQSRESDWAKVIERGLVWLAHMCHLDGDIAFFNDSTLGIAPSYADLCRYTSILGIPPPTSEASSVSVTHLNKSGYIVIASDQAMKLILDVGEVGPTYQPGHAHADTLSFELSLFGQRVFVNSGISQYGTGSERNHQRSTKAHNTVVVDGKNSSDVWGGFRVGQRAHPKKIQLTNTNKQVIVSCLNDGYCTLFNPLIHSRRWLLDQQHHQVTVTDTVSGNYQYAEARYYLHPDVQVQQLTDDHLQLILPAGKSVSLQFTNHAAINIENTQWYPGFGLSEANRCLVTKFTQHPLRIDINWQACFENPYP